MSGPGRSAGPGRRWLHYGSIAIIVASLFAIMARLPVREVLDRLQTVLPELGGWGMLAFGAIYVAAVILLVPGSAITIAAGLMFGLGWGVLVASLSSTTGVAATFLIGRYLARERVARLARRDPRFGAVDRAVREGGWKIVALLRLSPVVPFNLQNYLYGLTPIRFWTCILTSWAAMLPGTVLYVYLGYLARAGVDSAVGAADPGRWVLRIIGFAATVGAAVYLGRVALAAIREQTEIEASPPADDDR